MEDNDIPQPPCNSGTPRNLSLPRALEKYAPVKYNGKIDRTRGLDMEGIYKLAVLGCTPEEICAFLNIEKGHFKRCMDNNEAVKEVLEQGYSTHRVAIRQKQMEVALDDGNVPMLVHLAKTVLGQSERVQVEHKAAEGAEAIKAAWEIIKARQAVGAVEQPVIDVVDENA